MAAVIGITAGRELSKSKSVRTSLAEKYTLAIINAGGIPIILPTGLQKVQLPEVFDRLDGLIISGGGDIQNEKFNGTPHPRVSGVDPSRDEMEIEFAQMAKNLSKPLLGICRGHQVINVALGGNLFTDISAQFPGALRHDWYPDIPRDFEAHQVIFDKNSKIEQIIGGDKIQTNSLHHQAIKDLAMGLKATGKTSDGLIEVVELDDHPFFLGVQWHPEWMQAVPAMQNIFRCLVQAAESK